MIPDYMDRKHDYSFAKDRQLLNKLLAADDIFGQPKQTTCLSALRPAGNFKDSKLCEVTGWYPDDKVILRKAENDLVLSKPRTSVGTREGLLTRERCRKGHHDACFAFYHYPESHRYIEQYRREHTCTDSTNSATTRNEFLELQRFYSYRSQTGSMYTHPTMVGYAPPQPQTNTPTRREHSNIVQHRSSDTNLRSASRYKLSPSFNVRSDPEVSKETDQIESPLQVGANSGSSSKMAIHAVSKTPVPKVPAKVTVPANHSMISSGLNKTLKAGRKMGSPKVSSASWENSVAGVRTLDTLACVARPGDKSSEEAAGSTNQNVPELVAVAVPCSRQDALLGHTVHSDGGETPHMSNTVDQGGVDRHKHGERKSIVSSDTKQGRNQKTYNGKERCHDDRNASLPSNVHHDAGKSPTVSPQRQFKTLSENKSCRETSQPSHVPNQTEMLDFSASDRELCPSPDIQCGAEFPLTYSQIQDFQSHPLPVTEIEERLSQPLFCNNKGELDQPLHASRWTESDSETSSTLSGLERFNSPSFSINNNPQTATSLTVSVASECSLNNLDASPGSVVECNDPTYTEAHSIKHRGNLTTNDQILKPKPNGSDKCPESTNVTQTLSVIGISGGTTEEGRPLLGNSRKLTLLERKGNITLAPTRRGIGTDKDHTVSTCTDEGFKEKNKDCIICTDISSNGHDSINSSLEVVLSSQESVHLSQEDLDKCQKNNQERASKLPDPQLINSKDMSLFLQQNDTNQGVCNQNQEVIKCQKCDRVVEKSLSSNSQKSTGLVEDMGLNSQNPSSDKSEDACKQNINGLNNCELRLCQACMDKFMTDISGKIRKRDTTKCNIEENTHNCTDAACDGKGNTLLPNDDCMPTSFDVDGQLVLNKPSDSQITYHSVDKSDGELPVTDDKEHENEGETRYGASYYMPLSLVDRRRPLSPNCIQLSNETETQTKLELLILLHTKQPKYKSGGQRQIYTPSPRPGQKGVNKYEQRNSNPGVQSPHHRQDTSPVNQSLSTYRQARESDSFKVVRNRRQWVYPPFQSETDAYNSCQVTGIPKHDTIFSATTSRSQSEKVPMRRVNTAHVRTSAIPLHTSAIPCSPRKNVQVLYPHSSPVIVYHDNIGDMMVVGNECSQRPNTSPANALSTTPGVTARRRATQQARAHPSHRRSIRVAFQPASSALPFVKYDVTQGDPTSDDIVNAMVIDSRKMNDE